MPQVPNSLSLTNIADGSEIKALPLRSNYSSIQTEFNKVVDILDGGVSGQVMMNQGGGNVDWGDVPSGVPVASVMPYAGSSAPSGWLLCDGSAVSRTTYSALFGVIGTTYGAGDGSTTFNLPDLRGRVAVGRGTHADVDALNDNEGLAVASRRPQHRHTVTDPGHSHTMSFRDGAGTLPARTGSTNPETHATNAATTGITVGPAGASLDAPAYIVINYIIKH